MKRIKRWMACVLALCLLCSAWPALAGQEGPHADFAWPAPADREEAEPPAPPQPEKQPETEKQQYFATPDDVPASWRPGGGQTDGGDERPRPEDENADAAADTGEGNAYVYKDNGYRHYGTIRALIRWDRPIYLYTTDVLETTLSLDTIRRITFVLDPDVFSGSDEDGAEYFVYASERDPEGNTKEGTVFVWAGLAGQGPVSWKQDVEQDLNHGFREDWFFEYEIQVSAENYTADAPCAPVFLLTAYPELEEGMRFAVSCDGGESAMLDGSAFAPEASGEYRFYLLDAQGRTLARSARFRVQYAAEGDGGDAQGRRLLVTALPDAQTGATVFTLRCEPEQEAGMGFGVMVDGGPVQALTGDTYTAEVSGAYRFALLDGYGTVLAQTEAYVVTVSGGGDGDAPAVQPGVTEYELEVSAEGYAAGQTCQPTFTLTAHPELGEGMRYAVSVDGSVVSPMEGDTFSPVYSGEYRFAILSAKNIVLAYSAAYAVTCPAPWEEDDETVTEYELQVETSAYDPDGACMPAFTLTAHPAAESGMMYAYTRDGGDLTVLDGGTFAPQQSGEYRFYLLSKNETELARSGRYPVLYGREEIQQGRPAGFETCRDEVGSDETGDEDVNFDLIFSGHEVSPDGSETFVYESLADRVEITTRPGANRVQDGIELEVFTRYREGEVAAVPPQFTLYGLTEGDGYVYGVKINDGGYTTLSTSAYTAEAEGEYTLTFAIVDPASQTALQEKSYRVQVAPAQEGEGENEDDAQPDAVALEVTAEDETDGAWRNTVPAFPYVLTASTDLSALDYAFTVTVDGGEAQTLGSGQTVSYADYPVTEGEHTLVFAIADESGAAVSTVTRTLRLDYTAPLLTLTMLDGYGMNIIAGDTLSGGCTVTVEGLEQEVSGKAMTDAGNGVYSYSLVASQSITFPAGSIAVKDAAGNVNTNSVQVTLSLGNGAMGGAGGMGALGSLTGSGSFGGRGGSGRSVSHSESDTSVVIAYNAVELVVDDGSMQELVIGSEALGLSLTRNGAQAAFTAAFASRGSENDTLVLRASDTDASAGYVWSFAGTAYKKLAASGVDYLVLQVGQDAASLSTAGFSAGIRYNMYRAQGLASKAFQYDVQMGAAGFGINVTVEGQTYALSGDPGADYYYYDVYHGPMEQLHLQEN